MIKILYADKLPMYPKEKLSRCSGAENNLSSAEWRFMAYATAVSGTPKNIRELKRAARKLLPKQPEPPPLKKTSKVPAKPARKKPEAKLQQVSITVGIVGEDISQATFADMKRFMESRATVGLIALERGDATLQLHIQGVMALLSTSTKAVKQDIMQAIGWNSNCPLGGAVCVKVLTNKGIHTLVGMVG
ncbi:hypothetical protein R1sor_024091 [Riccia sorocarpa]|uniref:Uncharacterized protein n=1 Tax=Riccia sorocarpa TaxID=122646 RepID=A0ABD3GPI0_9MARC